MLYKHFPKSNAASSALGFGCMRLPVTNPDDATSIDEAEAIVMIRHAIDSGVTYIDTAYPYHGGASELLVGKALQDGYREKVLLATKLPVWKVEKSEDMMALLDEQLAKLQVDHVDFYLLHALNKERMVTLRKLNYKAFLDEAVRQGKIRFPAFSFHDDYATFMDILDDYPWAMCQVQMNILDGENQATLKGIEEAGKRGIGVVVMEPLRGGLLAQPPEAVRKVYEDFPTHRSPVSWAFRYLYTMPQVITILSGMSTMAQVEDNLRIFADAAEEPLTAQETELYAKVKAAYDSCLRTRCTGCAYCQPCPMGVQIPKIFQGVDRAALREGGSFKEGYAKIVAEGGGAEHCVKCRKCEKACPQHLPIVDFLHKFREELS